MLDEIIAHLKNELGSKNYDCETIFYTGNKSLPRWSGYKIGYYFVAQYLAKSGESINTATLASYSKIIK
jgi:uncharacterized protein YjaZ